MVSLYGPHLLMQATEEYDDLSAAVGPPLSYQSLGMCAGLKTQKKEALRRLARERRSEICRAQGDIGEVLAGIFFDDLSPPNLPGGQPSGHTGCVAGYWPIRDEPDPRPLMARLAALGWRCALPTVVPSAPLVFRKWQPGDDLGPGAYDIPEPLPGQPVFEPDLVLVPLLAFDRSGHRLGYGAGHYDRTLSQLRSKAQSTGQREICAIGLAYAGCECDALPVGAHDEAMDMIVTELGIVRPRARTH